MRENSVQEKREKQGGEGENPAKINRPSRKPASPAGSKAFLRPNTLVVIALFCFHCSLCGASSGSPTTQFESRVG